MADIRYTNKTEYNKKFCHRASLHNAFKKEKSIIPLIFIAITIGSAVLSLYRDPQSKQAITLLILGVFVLPVAFFIAPYFLTLREFSGARPDGKPMVLKTVFTNVNIKFSNPDGTANNVLYENLEKVQRHKDLLIISEKKSNSVYYLDANGFENADGNEAIAYIRSKTNLKK